MSNPPEEPHRIEFEVPWPPFTAYAYLIPAEEPILIDAGGPGKEGWAALTEGLDSAGYEPEDVEHLLVTHPHTDHDGQVERLLEVADPTVYTPEGVRERLARDPDDLAAVVEDNATEVGVPDVEGAIEEAVGSLKRNRSCLPPERIDIDVAFDEQFTAGKTRFEPIHVPGHQINQAAFLVGGHLFAGDALVEPFRPAALHVGFDRGYRECIDAFYEGLDRLAGYDIECVYPGHGPIFEDAAGAIERSRSDLDGLVSEVRETLIDLGEATAYEVTDARIDEGHRMQFSVFESVGALFRLQRRGVVDSHLDGALRRYVA